MSGGQKRTGEPGTAAGWGGSLRGLPRPDGRCPRDSRAGLRLRAEESLDKALLSPATSSAAGALARRCEHGAFPRPRPPRAASGCGCSYWPTFRATSKPGLRSRGEGGRAAPGASRERGLIRGRGRPTCLAHGRWAAGQGRQGWGRARPSPGPPGQGPTREQGPLQRQGAAGAARLLHPASREAGGSGME